MSTELTETANILENISDNIAWGGMKTISDTRKVNSIVGEMLSVSGDDHITAAVCDQLGYWLKNDNFGDRVNNFSAALIIENLPRLKEIAANSETNDIIRWGILDLVSSLADLTPYLDDEFKDKKTELTEILTENIQSRKKDVVYKLDSYSLYKNIGSVCRYGTDEQITEVEKWFKSRLDNVDYFEDVYNIGDSETILAYVLNNQNCLGLRNEFAKYIKQMGINLNRVETFWRNPKDQHDDIREASESFVGVYILRNVVTMRELEKRKTGSVKDLYDINGIVHFGSWPIELLQRQDVKSQTKKESIFLSMPVDNYNGAEWRKHNLFRKLLTDFGDEYNIIVCEIEPKNGYIHQENDDVDMDQYEVFKNRVTPLIQGKKIPFAWMMVHGSEKGFHYSRQRIGSEEFQNDNGGILLQQMEDDALLFLSSCSTGTDEPDGIGRQLTTMAPIRVVGPQKPGSSIKLEIGRDNGRFVINQIMEKDKDGNVMRVNMFKSGELIHSY